MADQKTRKVTVELAVDDPYWDALEQFRLDDARPSDANAMYASSLLGFEYNRRHGRPKGVRLVPERPEGDGPAAG